jgi:RNA ligase
MVEVEPGLTMLFEIVYPGNRIVCDYGGMDDLVLLGGVDITTGAPVRPGFFVWPGPMTMTFGYGTLAEALAAPPRPGAEGFVVRFPDDGHRMIKIKQADYVELHKIVTGLNARVVWESLGAGRTVADICEPLPDELHKWVRDLAEELQTKADMAYESARATHSNILEKLDQEHPDGWERKDYAAWAISCSNPAWLFNLLDGRDPRPAIWKTLRPSGDNRPVHISEDVA